MKFSTVCRKARWLLSPAMWTLRMACPSKSPIPMRATFVAEVNPIKILFAALLLSPALQNSRATTTVQRDDLNTAHQAYESGEYAKAAQLLQAAALQNPRDGEIHLFLAKTYYELQQNDAAVVSAEKAVSLDPQKSLYHEWLGKTYGEKAGHAGMFSALSLAKKARKEFERAVELDEKNFSAYQALFRFVSTPPASPA